MNKQQKEKQEGLSTREKVYESIVAYMLAYGYPPSVREIGDMAGLKSTSTVNWYLNSLRERGWINYETDKPRTITVPGVHYVDDRK